jgi:hypothetical protein
MNEDSLQNAPSQTGAPQRRTSREIPPMSPLDPTTQGPFVDQVAPSVVDPALLRTIERVLERGHEDTADA